MRIRKPPWRTVAGTAITVAVLAIVFVGVFPKFARYSEALSAIQRMPAAYVASLVLAAVVNVAVGAWPLQAALPGLRYRRAFVVGQTSFAFSNGIPGGGVISLGVEYDMLASYGIRSGAAASATAISSAFTFFVRLIMPIAGVLALLASGQVRWHYVLIMIVGVLIVGTAAAAVAVILHSPDGARKVGRTAERLLSRPARRFGRTVNVTEKALEFRTSVVDVMRRRWPLVLASTLLPQVISWLMLLLTLRGLEQGGHTGSAVTWSQSLAAYSFAVFASDLPITAGGLGTVDASLTALLVSFGATASQALAADLVWRAATFFPQLVTGVATFLWWRLTVRRGKRADPGQP
jgi:uncharacterized protein (TIRG00374 family)